MIHIQLPQFEGPLGLLLFLIRKDELDIYNIPIHTITQQYLDHIKKMRELDLEVAGDFIAMAATLIHIKSRMLLPQYDENGEPIEHTDDPRKELVQKLVEYQMYQEASKNLNQRPLLGRDTWARGLREELPVDEGDIIVDEGGLFSLISMYRKVVRQLAQSVHNVRAKGQSIASRILEIRDRLLVGQRVMMSELIHLGEVSSSKVLITFLSLLELTKMGFTNIFQSDTYGEIYIDTVKPVERDVIERVEEYDKKPEEAEALASALEGQAIKEHFHNVENEPEQEAIQEQLSFAPQEEIVVVEDLASDEEIFAAEAEMGIESSDINLELVERTLTQFSLEPNSDSAHAVDVKLETAVFEQESVSDIHGALDKQGAVDADQEPTPFNTSNNAVGPNVGNDNCVITDEAKPQDLELEKNTVDEIGLVEAGDSSIGVEVSEAGMDMPVIETLNPASVEVNVGHSIEVNSDIPTKSDLHIEPDQTLNVGQSEERQEVQELFGNVSMGTHSLGVTELEFEEAWSRFEDEADGIAIDREAQNLGEAQNASQVEVAQQTLPEDEDETDDFSVSDMNHIFKNPHEPESET